jgi:signal transduction histidine kinase
MREVSCRVFPLFFKPLKARGIPLEKLTEGTDLSIATLRNKQERIDWSDLCIILHNLSQVFDEDELRAIGRSYFHTPSLRFLFVVARILFTPMEFCRWVNKPREGAGNQMFSCVVPVHRELSDHELEIDLTLEDGYQICWEFFVITSGNFEEMPRLLGLPPAKVKLTRLPRGGRLHVTLPQRVRFLTRLRRALTWPFTIRAAARELKEAHETLLERYEQLEDARTKLARREVLLDTAYRAGQQIWSERDPSTTATAIAEALVEVSGFASATVDAAPTEAPERLERAAASNVAEVGEALRLDLSGRGRVTGEIVVTPRADADHDEAQTLLDLLAPTIALALDNAFAYRELADYQKGLERKVEERTAELREARDSLAETVRQLEEARDARERIFGNISHEIRTPLSLILLAVGDLAARAELGASARAQTGSIESSARKLLRLVDELLLLAAGEAGALELQRQSVDIGQLATTIITIWRPAAEAAGLTLALEAADDLVADADPIAIDRIVSNLLSNAIKFTPRGGRIMVRVEPAGPGLAIAVRDTGVGIDDGLFERLFGRFEQGTGAANVRSGSGIGLSLVKELAQAHGGGVTVERLGTGGSQFRVTLPRTRAPASDVALPEHRPSDFGLAAAPIQSGDVLDADAAADAPTLLIAEDDPALAASIAHLLADEYKVVVALDGLAAYDLAVRHQPHLLVTDVEMPGMSGVELTRRFRALPNNGLAPIVMLSALADLRDRITGLDAGAVDYVVKPFDPRELKARVRAQLEMRNLALRLHRAEKLAALGTLSAGLAHELRNPANGIVNAIAPLREVLPAELVTDDAPAGQLLEVLGGCAEQIASLSRQLLGFRRGGDLELRAVRIGDLVQRAVSLTRPALRGIELREHLDGDATVQCAAPLLVQVLTNLVENAAHAAGQGGWVEVATHAADGRIVVEVADSGPGVPPELRERIFEPFFTTKPVGSGTGLGLPIARDIIHRHGGILEIRERQHRPVFVIDLPNRTAQESR